MSDVGYAFPRIFKWCFAGMGGMAGWSYARATGSSIPLSYVAAGALLGFVLLNVSFGLIRLVKIAAAVGLILLTINYAILIPYGYGDHLAEWFSTGGVILRELDPSRIIGQWGKSVETRPSGH